jgi:hypothetical protein
MPGSAVEAPRRRVLLWIGGLLVAAVLAALVATLARENAGTAQSAIERRLATLAGTDIRYGALTLHARPRPELGSNCATGAARNHFLAVAAVTFASRPSAFLLLTLMRTRMSGGSAFFP